MKSEKCNHLHYAEYWNSLEKPRNCFHGENLAASKCREQFSVEIVFFIWKADLPVDG